jgi:hypothetical protein
LISWHPPVKFNLMPFCDKLMHRLLQSFDSKPMRFLQIVMATIGAILAFNAVGTLIYSALGQYWGSTAGKYSGVLYGVMLVAAVAFALVEMLSQNRWLILGSHMAVGAVVGFYYGGTAMALPPAQQAPWAISGAIIGSIGCGLLTWGQVLPMVLGSVRTIVIYGAAFLNGAIGLMLLSVGNILGLVFWGIAIFSLWATGRSFYQMWRSR